MTSTTSTVRQAPGGTAETGFTHRQILTILSGLMLGMFLAALDQNIVSTSIRTIADDLHGLNLQAWATTAYLITATISTPLYGKLSDLYGRKPFFLFAIGLFVAGSVLCTISTSMYELAAFRAIQGAGAGGLMSLALTIIGDIVPPRQRARYQGYFLAMFGTSSVVGPVVGGFFAGQDSIIGITGWRWVFLVNVPIGVVALVVVAKVLNLPHSRRERRIDWPGATALAVALVPILTVAEQGRSWGWGSAWSIGCYVIGVLGLIGFVLAERHYGDDALLPPHLFRNGVFTLTSIIGVITGIGMFGGISILPQYLQIVTGSDPTRAGLQMIPLIGGMMFASIVSGQLTSRTGRYKVFPVVGLGLMTLGMVLFHFLLHATTPYWQVALLMVLFGLGLGNCMQTLTLAVQNAVPAKDMGVATASATFFRQMGGTLGVAVFLSVLFSTVGDSITSALRTAAGDPGYQAALADPAVRADPANAVGLNPATGASQIVQDSSALQRMDGRLAQPFLEGFAHSMDIVFLCAAAVVAVGFVLIWFLRELPLRAVSGIQAREAEERPADAPAAVPPAVSPAEAAPAAQAVALAAPTSVAPVPAGVHDVTGNMLAGRVGGPTTGATIALHDLDGAVVDHERVDGGDYELHAPRAGTYVLIASPVDRAPHAELVTLDGGPRRHDVTLGEIGAVAGTVSSQALDGRGLAGATVTLTDPAGTVRAVRRTGTDGTWLIDDLAPGTYVVTVLADGHQPAAGRLHVGASPERHDTALEAARRSVCGTIVGAGRRPVVDSLVVLIASDGSVVASSVTGPDGRFRFDGVPAGRHMLTASGYPPASETVTVPSGGTTDVTLEVVPPRTGALEAPEAGRHELGSVRPDPRSSPARTTT